MSESDVRRIVWSLPNKVKEQALYSSLIATARDRARIEAEKIERRAAVFVTETEKKISFIGRDAEKRERKAKFNTAVAKMAGIVGSIYQELNEQKKMQWTQELLNTIFSTTDGSRVTWGNATIAQHQDRIVMFEQNAAINLEGASRHVAAIEALREAGVSCLNELKSRAA
jgi:hypothetical protein